VGIESINTALSTMYPGGSWANERCWSPDSGIPFNQSTPFKHGFTEKESETAVEQFWK